MVIRRVIGLMVKGRIVWGEGGFSRRIFEVGDKVLSGKLVFS